MMYKCDCCGQEFEDDEDCAGDACNRCDEGTIEMLLDVWMKLFDYDYALDEMPNEED